MSCMSHSVSKNSLVNFVEREAALSRLQKNTHALDSNTRLFRRRSRQLFLLFTFQCIRAPRCASCCLFSDHHITRTVVVSQIYPHPPPALHPLVVARDATRR